jgi:hypothetical protein
MYPKTSGDTSFNVSLPRVASNGVVNISMAESYNPNTNPTFAAADVLWKVKYNTNVGARAAIIQSSSVTLETRVINKTTGGNYSVSLFDTAHAKLRVTTGTSGVNAAVVMPAGNTEIDGRMFVLELESTSGSSGITGIGSTATTHIADYITNEISLFGAGIATYMMMYSSSCGQWLIYSYFICVYPVEEGE